MNGPAVVSWIVTGIPCAAVSIVSAYKLIEGGSAWWLAGFVFAALLAPEADKS